MVMLQTDQMAPDFTLPDVDGQLVSLSAKLHEGLNILLVFLRHLG